MSITISYPAPGYASEPAVTYEGHVAVNDGKAYQFPKCG